MPLETAEPAQISSSAPSTTKGGEELHLGKDNTLQTPVFTATDWFPCASQDLGNPHNWPWRKKASNLLVPPLVGLLCPLGSSIYTPGLAQVQSEFNVSRELALLPFTFYLLGLSFGPVIAAPMSETFGRRIVYMTALPIFAAFTLGAGFSTGIVSLTVCRFFAGMASSPGLSLGSGTVADILAPHDRAIFMALFVTAVQFGPVLGPLIGGFVVEKNGWRWTQWVILFGIAGVLAVTLFMDETYKAKILERRARFHGVEGPSKPDRTRKEAIEYFATRTIIRPLHMLCTEPICIFMDIYTAFIFGLLNAFFAAFSWVFETVYGFNAGNTGLTYLGQLVGSVAGFCVLYSVEKLYWSKEVKRARLENPGARVSPEKRLILAKIGGPLLPISLFWFGWTASAHVHWVAPVIAEALFSCANILIFTCALIYLQDCYGAQYGASAASSNTFLRYLSAFAFPLFVIQMYEFLGIGWATSLLGFVSIVLVPIPFMLDYFGEKIRANSRFIPEE